MVTAVATLTVASAGVAPPSLAADIDAPASSPAVAALRAVADTAANRQLIIVNNLAAIWRSGGLPSAPSLKQAVSRAGDAASSELFSGSPLGTGLWQYVANYPAPFGYNPLALTEELSVGNPPHELSEVWGPIDAENVEAVLSKLKAKKTRADGVSYFDLGPAVGLLRPAPYDTALIGVVRVGVPAYGRLVTGGAGVPAAGVAALGAGSAKSGSLLSDPSVAHLLSLWPESEMTVMGSSLVETARDIQALLGPNAPASDSDRLAHRLGLQLLPAAPTFAGVAFLGGRPSAAHYVAAAIYPSPTDAKAAARVLGTDLRTALDVAQDLPYDHLWHVNDVSAVGSTVVARFTVIRAGAVAQALDERSFPLFYAPFP